MLSRVSVLLLGPPGKRQWQVLMTVLTFALYGLFALLQQAQVWLGFIDARASGWLTAYYLLGSLGFYMLVRTGWSARVSRDPSLMQLQTLHGVLAVTWSYAITGPARGAVLAILVLLLGFGMFGLTARQARRMSLFSFALLGLTMAWMSHSDPLRYPLQVEAVHFAFVVVVLLGVSALSLRMGALHERLRSQKRELEGSLERIRLLATQDELTGLVNRRHMSALSKAEQTRQLRTGKVMSLVMIDLDHFKRINDSHGHQAGDMVLRTFVQAVSPSLRGSDVLSRWGGEEFLLLLPETDETEALHCVDRMRTHLAQASFDDIASGLRPTFSAGLATGRPGESFEAVFEQADKAMYRAKEAGRNCTVSA